MHSLITDNDSTLMQQEILDEIARFAGSEALKKIEDITNSQMNGVFSNKNPKLTFLQSLETRVNILVNHTTKKKQPITKSDLQKIAKTQMNFSENAEKLLQIIIEKHGSLKSKFFIFSGGFKEIIFYKIDELNIPETEKIILKNQTYANCFKFTENTNNPAITGLDIENSQMLSETAKLDKTNFLIENNLIEYHPESTEGKKIIKIIGLGDGSNDVGMVPEKYGFCVAYTEHAYRENTVKKANNITANSFIEVQKYLEN